jgi:transposase
MKLSTLSLDHLGSVAAIFDSLGISEVIDELMPKTRDFKLSHSAIIKALIINGLGFVERRLYIFPSYFENLALERLFYQELSRKTLMKTLSAELSTESIDSARQCSSIG